MTQILVGIRRFIRFTGCKANAVLIFLDEFLKFTIRSADKKLSHSLKYLYSTETFSFDWEEKLEVTLSPFNWDWCEAKLFGLPGSPDWKPLVDWFMSSFHESSPSDVVEGFSGVVHFMSDPELQGDCYEISFDLGSAPVETFQTLLDAFVSIGAKAVEIGQFEDVQEVAAVET